jgi:hypothetical protein
MRIQIEEMHTILDNHTTPVDTFVETGTMKATMTMRMNSVFSKVYSVELSYELYSRAIKLHGAEEGVKFIYGDSGEVIKWLSDLLPHPTCFLLDAHKCRGGIRDRTNNINYKSAGKGAFPLWKELDVIRSRPYDDIVLVDDVCAFGRPDSDWKGVSKAAILDYVKQTKVVNKEYVISDDYCLHLGGLHETHTDD